MIWLQPFAVFFLALYCANFLFLQNFQSFRQYLRIFFQRGTHEICSVHFISKCVVMSNVLTTGKLSLFLCSNLVRKRNFLAIFYRFFCAIESLCVCGIILICCSDCTTRNARKRANFMKNKIAEKCRHMGKKR